MLQHWVSHSRLKKAKHLSEIKLVVGSGGIYDKGWIPSDSDTLNLLKPKSWNSYFKAETISAILAEHVWEHLTEDQGLVAAKTCYEFLKNDGYLRVAVPDGFHFDSSYIEAVKPGGTGYGSDDHKVLYNYVTFSEIFKRAGFKVALLEYFDEKGEFHFSSWEVEKGMVRRSKRFDERNKSGNLTYTSLILDCYKK